MSLTNRISAAKVIDRILDLIEAMPELGEGLPEGWRRKAFWKDLFARNDRTRRMLELLRELPVFTTQAPRSGSARAWRKAMEPVWKKFEGDIGRDLIDAALKANN